MTKKSRPFWKVCHASDQRRHEARPGDGDGREKINDKRNKRKEDVKTKKCQKQVVIKPL